MNRRVLITGASSGIGRALASEYLSANWQVIACGRDQLRLGEMTDCQTLKFDVCDRNACLQAASEVDSLDLVILNAGTCEYINDPMEFDAPRFERVIQTNLIAVAYCLEAFLSKLSVGGQVALMGSAASVFPFTRAQAYGASKAGVDYLADALRVDLKWRGIDVSLIRPGFVRTPLTEKNDFSMPGLIEAPEAALAIRRGLEKRKAVVAVPWVLNATLALLGTLPIAMQTWISQRMRQG